MSSSVEQIKERLTIENVIGSYIKLEKAGANLKARCPFHNEKTPSFFVSPDRGSYYCFGCGKKGDIFTFVEEFEHVDFVGALKMLANKAGVELPKYSMPKDDAKERLYALLEEATKFLEKNLAGEDIAREYLVNRGLTEKTIADWRIGYVRDEWRSISDHLKAKGFSDAEIERAGISKTENNSTYDRFRGRIMFPIFDPAGRVIGFSGRILHDDGKSAKYLNSPQTEIFDKSRILYGYDRAKQSIRKADFSILVEGQMDLLMAHQAGFTNTVASSGTALTASHLALVKRISNKIIMSFDADTAGAKAAERAWALALAAGMEVKVAAIPDGFDPADLIKKDKEAFKEVLKSSVHLIDFLLLRAQKDLPAQAGTTDGKKLWQNIQKNILPYIYLLESSTEQTRHVKKIAELIKVKEDFIWDDLKKVKLDEDFKRETAEENKAISDSLKHEALKRGSALRSLMSILVWQESTKESLVPPEGIRKKLEELLPEQLIETCEQERKAEEGALAFEAESYYGDFDTTKLEKELRTLLHTVREEILRQELAERLTEIQNAEKEKDKEKIEALLLRITDIQKKLGAIKSDKDNQ